ncbi:MAG: DUF373 family protein [Desulfurococcales archaeon]|nr:DUF373 family protein [Desulfurococcales archaeon]
MEVKGVTRRPLILVVDVDDDISDVVGKSVIVGEDDVRKALMRYGIERPEDADVNAMFSGLQVYEKLKREGRNPEIAVVGGHRLDFVEAQRLIRERVKKVVEEIKAPVEILLISDGEDELYISEVLRDIAPIAGFKRVVVEQHLGIEGSYILIFRYLRKAAIDPRFSKYFLGLPGSALLVMALLSLLNLLDLAVKVLLILIGGAMIVRGFNLEEPLARTARDLTSRLKGIQPLSIASLTILVLFTLATLFSIGDALIEDQPWHIKLSRIFKYSIPLMSIGAISYIVITRILYKVIEGDLGLWREAALITVLGGVAFAFFNLGSYMEATKMASYTASLIAESLIESGFASYILISSSIAAISELIGRTNARRHE